MSVDFLKFNTKNQNTTKATESWYRKYCKWAEKTKNVKEIQNVEKNELNIILENFFADVTRDDGKQLEPISLCSMQAALYRYLKDGKLIYSFSCLV